jgi:hypothetical protein
MSLAACVPLAVNPIVGPCQGCGKLWFEVGRVSSACPILFITLQNRLEALKDDRKGQWSIRINDQ